MNKYELFYMTAQIKAWLDLDSVVQEQFCPFSLMVGIPWEICRMVDPTVFTRGKRCREVFPEMLHFKHSMSSRYCDVKLCPCTVLGIDFVKIRADQWVKGELDIELEE